MMEDAAGAPMEESTGSAGYEYGDLVSALVGGEWLDGEYLGFVPGEGHFVRIVRGSEVCSNLIRTRGGLYA
jgi:hypothetical protein